MPLNYKKELENASRTMILVHEPDVLVKLIVRMLVQQVKVTHAGALLHDPEKNTYVLTVSRGKSGLKIPAGFARIDADNALIRFFQERPLREYFKKSAVLLSDLKKVLNKKISSVEKRLIEKVIYQMEIFDAELCIPSYFRDELLAVAFLGKKSNKKAFRQDEIDFFTALASDVAMAIRNARLFKELELELDRKYRLFIHTTVALAAAIDAKDHYTHGHTSRVTSLSLGIVRKLGELNNSPYDSKFLESLHIAALLHDIGKIGIPESILNKEGPLNEEETKKMRQHPVVGAAILQPIKELGDAILGVKYHHERFDGSGYPEGLKGEEIPLIASIISIADAFDAMTTDRPYRKALSKEEAIEEIKKGRNKQFNALIADAFIQFANEGKNI